MPYEYNYRKRDIRTEVKKKHPVRNALLGVLFFLGVIFCFMGAAQLLAPSIMAENIIACAGLVLAALLMVAFVRWLVHRTLANAKHTVLLALIIIVAVFAGAAFSLSRLTTTMGTPATGKNINTSSYNHDYSDFGSTDLEGLISTKCGNAEGTQVARIDTQDYHEVLFQAGKDITSYEFAQEGGRYFYLGRRTLLYQSAWIPTDSYTWQETVYADAVQNNNSHQIRHYQEGDSDPAWGVTEFDPTNTVLINGECPDQVVALDNDGESAGYLWIYNNVGNTEELKLEDVAVEYEG